MSSHRSDKIKQSVKMQQFRQFAFFVTSSFHSYTRICAQKSFSSTNIPRYGKTQPSSCYGLRFQKVCKIPRTKYKHSPRFMTNLSFNNMQFMGQNGSLIADTYLQQMPKLDRKKEDIVKDRERFIVSNRKTPPPIFSTDLQKEVKICNEKKTVQSVC